MKKYLFFLCISSMTVFSYGQVEKNTKRKFKAPLWTYHSQNTDILGLSFGLAPGTIAEKSGTTNTFGVRLEVDPISVFYFMFGNNYDVADNLEEFGKIMTSKVGQKSYGLNISTGNIEHIDTYGISITALIQKTRINNGISIAGWSNQIEKSNGIMIGLGSNSFISNGISIGLSGAGSSMINGIQIGGMVNVTEFLNGIQIGASNEVITNGYGLQVGLWNKAKNFKGIQLGLWNENSKRALPILNWDF